MSKLNTDFVMLVFSMSIVLVMGINTTSINIAIALDRGELTELWVAKVTGFSSQYNTGSWSANQVIGQPNVYPRYGDIAGTWAPRTTRNKEFLELEFSREIYIKNISVYETFNSGAVTGIRVWDSRTKTYQFVYQGRAVALTYSRIFTPPIDTVAFKSKRIRLDLDCTVSPSWCEIDAVKIVGNGIFSYSVISDNPLPEDMGQLINSSTFSDVSFMVEGRNIFAHKAILAQRSAYFDNLFSNTSLQNLILVSGIKYSTFMSLLEFMYMGKINCRLDAPTLQKLFQMMSTYDMGGLQRSLSDCFFNKTSEETALTNISELASFSQHQRTQDTVHTDEPSPSIPLFEHWKRQHNKREAGYFYTFTHP